MITKSTLDFLNEKPELKYAFFGGKGGVGKTVLAGAAALWLAQQGKRTLLASTNPVHSLSSLLDQDVFGVPTPVNDAPNMIAYEIDTGKFYCSICGHLFDENICPKCHRKMDRFSPKEDEMKFTPFFVCLCGYSTEAR